MAFPIHKEAPSAGQTVCLQGWVSPEGDYFSNLHQGSVWAREGLHRQDSWGRQMRSGKQRKFTWATTKWMQAASPSIFLGGDFWTLLPIPKHSSLPTLLALAPILNFLPSWTIPDHSFSPSSHDLPLYHLLHTVFPESPTRTNHCLPFSPSVPPAVCTYTCLLQADSMCNPVFQSFMFLLDTRPIDLMDTYLQVPEHTVWPFAIPQSWPKRAISDSLTKEIRLWMSRNRVGAKSWMWKSSLQGGFSVAQGRHSLHFYSCLLTPNTSIGKKPSHPSSETRRKSGILWFLFVLRGKELIVSSFSREV